MAGLENTTGTGEVNGTGMENPEADSFYGFIVASGFVLLTSLLGIIGNSLVFWYLGFRIKRTKYTIYIINLAVADLIYLIFISIFMCVSIVLFQGARISILNLLSGLEIMLGFGSYADMFLLTAISVERCMAILYPIWYRHNRPKFLSITVCTVIWVLSASVTLLDNLGCPPLLFGIIGERCTGVHVFLSVLVLLICIPIMITSSLILLINVRRTSKQVQPPKLIIVIVATVIVFLISVAPMRILWLLLYLQVLRSYSATVFMYIVYFFISINSSVNPFIYFLVGRHHMRGVREYLEKTLKNVFREEEDEVVNNDIKGHEERNTTESNIS